MKITNITQLGNSSANITVDIEDDIINNKYMEYPEMLYKYEYKYKVTVKPKSIVEPMPCTLITRTIFKSDIDEYLKNNINKIQHDIQGELDIEYNLLS